MNDPGSPPELVDSQSSERSSYASQFSIEEPFGGSMNFEEISLGAENHTLHDDGRAQPWASKSTYRNAPKTSARPALATLQTQQVGNISSRERQAQSSDTPHSRRTFTTPTISSPPRRTGQRTRTNAYILHKNKSTSGLTRSTTSTDSNASLASVGRRGSWQPTRKNVYEIEAEYHDSDDELPDDASLFNVPISPFVSTTHLAPSFSRSSPGISPDRSPVRSPLPIPLSHYKSAPANPPKQYSSNKTSSRSSQRLKSTTSLVSQARSTPTSPRPSPSNLRTKSWNLAMADLDHEARVVAQKLDFHHESRSKSPAPGHRSATVGSIPLPPIQRGTLDFMPCSKEKEAVLSRTRPPWLPPKDPREEKKHLEQYKKMMKASLEADKKREEAAKKPLILSDDNRDSIKRIWTYFVDPSTDLTVIDKRVNHLCWCGLPVKLRGAIWQRKVGNPLKITSQDYRIALEKVQEIKSRPIEKLDSVARNLQEWFADIERDAETAFPDLSLFQGDNIYWQNLIDLCEVFVLQRTETGYVYGLQLIAAAILTQIPDPSAAFVLLANCLDKTVPWSFLSGDVAVIARTCAKVKSTLNMKYPDVHAHLFNSREDGGLGFSGDELLDPIFRTVFANGLDLDRLCRVFDMWIFEGDGYLVRTAVALIGALETQILDIKGDVDSCRRNTQEMLGWGPYNRIHGGYFELASAGSCDTFVDLIQAAGRLDCTETII